MSFTQKHLKKGWLVFKKLGFLDQINELKVPEKWHELNEVEYGDGLVFNKHNRVVIEYFDIKLFCDDGEEICVDELDFIIRNLGFTCGDMSKYLYKLIMYTKQKIKEENFKINQELNKYILNDLSNIILEYIPFFFGEIDKKIDKSNNINFVSRSILLINFSFSFKREDLQKGYSFLEKHEFLDNFDMLKVPEKWHKLKYIEHVDSFRFKKYNILTLEYVDDIKISKQTEEEDITDKLHKILENVIFTQRDWAKYLYELIIYITRQINERSDRYDAEIEAMLLAEENEVDIL